MVQAKVEELEEEQIQRFRTRQELEEQGLETQDQIRQEKEQIKRFMPEGELIRGLKVCEGLKVQIQS